MLAKLDDQLDRRDYASSSPLSAYVAGEPVPPSPSPPPPARSPDMMTFTTDNIMIGRRPPITARTPRQPLSVVVTELSNQWSAAFLDLARQGDASSMILVAQMYLVPKGYGLIKYNKAEGIRWVMRAVEMGESEAAGIAQRFCPAEYHAFLERSRR